MFTFIMYTYIYIHRIILISIATSPPGPAPLPHTMLQKPRAESSRFLALAVVARASGSAAPQSN